MRTEWLEYFADAAHLGSIKASADKHFISPQGLSRSITELEKELGVTLFVRGANSIRLTPSGEMLLPIVRQAVVANEKVLRFSQEVSSESMPEKSVILCSTFVFICGMMSPLRAAVETGAGGKILYRQTKTNDIFDTLLQGSEDEGFEHFLMAVPLFLSPISDENDRRISALKSHGYRYLPYLTYHDGVLISRNHPLAANDSVSRSDLDPYLAISSGAEQLRPLQRYLGASHIGMEITDLVARLQMIQSSQNYILVPPFLDAAGDDEHYRFLTLEDPYQCEVGFLFRSDEACSTLDTIDLARLDDFYRPFQERGLCTIVPRP